MHRRLLVTNEHLNKLSDDVDKLLRAHELGLVMVLPGDVHRGYEMGWGS